LSALGHLELPSDGAVEHATECSTIDRAGMGAEPNDPTRVLIHDNQDPVGTQRCRLAPEQIRTSEAVVHVAKEREPGWRFPNPIPAGNEGLGRRTTSLSIATPKARVICRSRRTDDLFFAFSALYFRTRFGVIAARNKREIRKEEK